eukprot:364053-Chlamydomonas_euryale.AAC.7
MFFQRPAKPACPRRVPLLLLEALAKRSTTCGQERRTHNPHTTHTTHTTRPLTNHTNWHAPPPCRTPRSALHCACAARWSGATDCQPEASVAGAAAGAGV